MRIILWLSTLAVLTTGCATTELPPAGTYLRDYDDSEPTTIPAALPLQQFEVSDQGELICTAQKAEMLMFIEGAKSNSKALNACSSTVAQLEVEKSALLASGRAAERESELFRQYAIDTGRECRWIQAGALGATGFLAVVLGIGAL